MYYDYLTNVVFLCIIGASRVKIIPQLLLINCEFNNNFDTMKPPPFERVLKTDILGLYFLYQVAYCSCYRCLKLLNVRR